MVSAKAGPFGVQLLFFHHKDSKKRWVNSFCVFVPSWFVFFNGLGVRSLDKGGDQIMFFVRSLTW